MRSTRTFEAEFDSIARIPGLMYTSPGEYVEESGGARAPFGVLYDIRSQLQPADQLEFQESPGLPQTDFEEIPSEFVFAGALAEVYAGAFESDDAFAEAMAESLGIDIEHLLDEYAELRRRGNGIDIATLTARLGSEAFGTYLPWHAFARSEDTPWGMYIFLEPLVEWTTSVHSQWSLPFARPSALTLFRLLLLAVYRHELFHFHVERFAIRQEVLQRAVIYRRYEKNVHSVVSNKSNWLEEALAQAVVLKSVLLRSRSGISRRKANQILIPEFRRFGPGYRDFECTAYGGPAEAHRVFGAQVARGVLRPDHPATDFATPLREYGSDPQEVPGYVVWHRGFVSRFQLTLPKLREFERFASKAEIELVKNGPGDHRTYRHGRRKFQVNPKRGVVDLASIKAMAKVLQVPVHELSGQIRSS